MPGELSIIDKIRRRSAAGNASRSSAVRLGIGDDCAVLRPPSGSELVVTTDFSLEGVHFRREWHPAASIGHRVLARGLSDIAAMGAKPMAAFLSLALPRVVASDAAWLDGFLTGLLSLANECGVTLAGGDTSESPTKAVLADIMLIGSAPRGKALLRSGARAGDELYCTGWLGGAAQELASLSSNPKQFAAAKPGASRFPHLFPMPRLAAGRALSARGLATACIDLSDGLSTDLAHLCEASGVGAEVLFDKLPRAPELRVADARFATNAMLHGGEDYELLFTARPEAKVPKRLGGIPVTCIGSITPAPTGRRARVRLLGADSKTRPLPRRGWEHLK